ncbi:hypothetical protein BDZ85DRAFT_262908 [Elsinoe ampelina]|uniref:Uncharacterized protein n=1 Tax=Elsinoe ampelina TaxID=302913 RepID=A0A6A6GCG3_9PEZI|nr:hypothetical protein BDZ85DRAFT_262908 [Elsinoe ampelina]
MDPFTIPPFRPEAERHDSAFSSLSTPPISAPSAPAKRSAVHTPVLQSIDTSPASIDAFKRLQPAPATGTFVRGFGGEGNPGSGDIFGISIPIPQDHEQAERRENMRFRNKRARGSAGGLGKQNRENGSEYMDAVMGEPSKAPVWVRDGSKRPLGEMRIDVSAGNVDDSLDDSAEIQEDPFNTGRKIRARKPRDEPRWSASSSEGERNFSREYPPSPKKSPVKRLLFKTDGRPRGLDFDSTYGSVNASQDEAEVGEEDSFLGGMANGFMQRRGKGKEIQPAEEEDEPAELQHFHRIERPRARRSLMRRRRTTVHEDPITSPKVDSTSRITKPDPKRVGSGSSLSSVEEAAVVQEVAGKTRPGLPRRTSLMELEDTPRKAEKKKVAVMERQMWDACGRDTARWNRGDFSSGAVNGLAEGLVVACRW